MDRRVRIDIVERFEYLLGPAHLHEEVVNQRYTHGGLQSGTAARVRGPEPH
jgi:hypothetical protein